MSEQSLMHWAPQPGYDEASVMCDPHMSVFKHTDKIADVTCPACLREAMELGRGAERRIMHLGMIDVAAENLAHPADLAQPSAWPGSPAHVEMWDAINEFCRASGGRTDATNIGRQAAVARVERAMAARASEIEDHRRIPSPGVSRLLKTIEDARAMLQISSTEGLAAGALRVARTLADCQADLVAAHGALPADCGEGAIAARIGRVVAQRDELRRIAPATAAAAPASTATKLVALVQDALSARSSAGASHKISLEVQVALEVAVAPLFEVLHSLRRSLYAAAKDADDFGDDASVGAGHLRSLADSMGLIGG